MKPLTEIEITRIIDLLAEAADIIEYDMPGAYPREVEAMRAVVVRARAA